jgi:3-oxoacyl-(acyl-carrier-protein) synthase
VPHAVTSAIAFTLGFRSRLLTVSNGCASGLDAVAIAAAEIARDRADIVIAGSSDAAVTPYVFKCFEASRRVSLRNDRPREASRPFDRDRDGGVASEGAGVVILENLEHALARGATPYATIGGFGTGADYPDSPEGSGLEDAMRQALIESPLRPEHIDHISAHAPSDAHMDSYEVAAIKRIFGPHAYRVPVTSIKGNTGNPMSVGGVHQLIAAALAMRHGLVPPTANLVNPDPACDLDHVPGQPRAAQLAHVLINTHGFGRGNSALVLHGFDDGGRASGLRRAP